MGGAYEDEGPGDVVFFQVEMVDEEDEDAGDDEGREELGESEEVEGEGRVWRGLFGDSLLGELDSWEHDYLNE